MAKEAEIHSEYVGKACTCRAGIIGIVKGIRVEKGKVIYFGHKLGDPSQSWQSRHPTPCSTSKEASTV